MLYSVGPRFLPSRQQIEQAFKIGADSIAGWYFDSMKYHRSEASPPLDPVTKMAQDLAGVMAERSRMNKDLLIALAHAVARNERTQHRFRNAVITRLSNIETTVNMIHGAQIMQTDFSKPIFGDKAMEVAKDAEEFASKKSKELGINIVKYVYDDSEAQPEQPERGRKRRQPVSYDI